MGFRDDLKPPHFRNGRYFNPGAPGPKGLLDLLKWKLTSRPERSPAWIPDVVPSQPPPHAGAAQWLLTLVNHSTVLLQTGSLNLLTDPVWSERVSPVSWAGPRRHRAPGVRMADLPPLDAVLLSHNHYDHLDLPALRELAAMRTPRFIVPMGCGKILRSAGIGPVEELDWGMSTVRNATTIHCVPAIHFCGRSLFDRNRALWCGYVIEDREGVAYFAADTGFGDHFQAIRTRFGQPRLALLPVGAYLPRWFMSAIHMSPEDALRAHRILEPAVSIAIHHGTFQLADDGVDEPRGRLAQLSGAANFRVLANGESCSC
jgi:L-ascorbate metabolism protein UlaG (beta-lactamase superfamily)